MDAERGQHGSASAITLLPYQGICACCTACIPTNLSKNCQQWPTVSLSITETLYVAMKGAAWSDWCPVSSNFVFQNLVEHFLGPQWLRCTIRTPELPTVPVGPLSLHLPVSCFASTHSWCQTLPLSLNPGSSPHTSRQVLWASAMLTLVKKAGAGTLKNE